MLRLFKKKALAVIGAIFLTATASPICAADAPVKNKTQLNTSETWKHFHSVQGKCKISLPASPEHVKQIMPFPEEGYNLRYDVYVSAHEKKAVYMMLIAEYPPFINESHAEMSLESFLNGLVSQNAENELIFADLTDVQGHKALDFFIQTKGVYFKGRAIMAANHLYLLAMECDVSNYLDGNYTYFINSFELVK